MNIYEKILAVVDKVGKIPKNGYNSFSKYHYVDKDTLYDYMRKYLSEQKLVVLADVEVVRRDTVTTDKGDKNKTIVNSSFTIINAEKPDEKVVVKMPGLGEDKTDKDLYQALTGAMKYFFINNFLISGGDSYPGDVEHVANQNGKNGTTVEDGFLDKTLKAKKWLFQHTKSDETFLKILQAFDATEERQIVDKNTQDAVLVSLKDTMAQIKKGGDK